MGKKKTPALSIGKVTQVRIADLAPDPDQPRRTFEKDSLARLAASIKARGVMQPLQVRPDARGKLVILDGERRWRAAKSAGLKTVPVLLADKREDTTQILLDQVAINEQRENLTQIEIGLVLRGLRDDQKKSPNEIAAYLAKNGMGAMTKVEVDGLIALTFLPTWAHEMVDAGTVELKHLTPLVKHAKSKEVMEVARESIAEQIDWGGKATARDVEQGIEHGLEETHQRLDGEALFDWKKICQGCAYLVRNGGSGYCTDAKQFEMKQTEAKKQAEARGAKARVNGGADKPREPTAQEIADRKRQRTTSLRGKVEEYLWAYLLRKCAPEIHRATFQLVRFAALKRPGITGWNNSYQAERSLCPGCHYPAGGEMPQEKLGYRKAAQDQKIHALDDLLEERTSSQEIGLDYAIALETLFELPFRETLVLAHHLLGDDIAKIWILEKPFLDLFRNAELVHLAEKHKVPAPMGTWDSMKGADMKAAILKHPKLVREPQILVDLYAKVSKPDRIDD
jgi:ParB/RepB/Spo0J family partition protein